MGITIIHKSGGDTRVKKGAKKALILAGGAVTGGLYKAGGLKALNDYFVDYTVSDFDIFVGVSSGSLLITPIAGGVSPEEMIRSLDGHSERFSPLLAWHFYYPNIQEFVTRPINYFMDSLWYFPKLIRDLTEHCRQGALGKALLELGTKPSYAGFTRIMHELGDIIEQEDFPHWMRLLPTGLFDNSTIERYLRNNIKKNSLTNNFKTMHRATGKRLYICAMSLDSAERVVFGPDEKSDVTISEAVQASTALPGFYKPARIKNVDYVDGGVLETAHVGIAIEKEASLVICYNPFRPFDNQTLVSYLSQIKKRKSSRGRLADQGILAVFNQIIRTVYHKRLHKSIERYRTDADFKGDIILIEPKASELDFFEMNPLRFGHRMQAAVLGFESVRNSINERFDEISSILKKYGLKMSKQSVEADLSTLKKVRASRQKVRNILEGKI